jgi:hypothetical protein
MLPYPSKIVNAIPPAAILDNAAATSTCVDTAGYDWALFVVTLGATDIAATVLRVQESDTTSTATALASGATVTGLDFTASLPSATDDNEPWAFAYPLKGRKRYQQVQFTAGDGSAGTYVAAQCHLFNGDSVAFDATSMGLGGLKYLPA